MSEQSSQESDKERVDRELIELLNELRVALPGVQVLFAFLLILPFSQGFAKLAAPERGAFIVALLFAAASAALLMAPAAFHRLNFRAENKEKILFTSNRLTIVGQGLLAAAMSLVVFVVTSPIVPTWGAVAMTLATATFFGWAWYWVGIIIVRRSRRRSSTEEPGPPHRSAL